MSVSQLIKYYSDFFEDMDEAKAEEMLRSLELDKDMKLKKCQRVLRKKYS